MAGKTALVNGKLVTGTGKMDTRDRIYEATLYCGWYVTRTEPLWGNWSGSMTITDEKNNIIAELSVGTSRNQLYEFTGGASATKTIKFNIPLRSKENHTYTVKHTCGWWSNTTDPLYGNWSGSVTINDITDIEALPIKTITIGTARNQLYNFPSSSASDSISGTFTNP